MFEINATVYQSKKSYHSQYVQITKGADAIGNGSPHLWRSLPTAKKMSRQRRDMQFSESTRDIVVIIFRVRSDFFYR